MGTALEAQVLLTCEHGGNRVPDPYRALFRGKRRLLASHRGLDIGAYGAAVYLQRALRAPLIAATVTRLLIDLNRSSNHRALFSDVTRGLTPGEKRTIREHYYDPYRELVAGWLEVAMGRGERVIHLSVHSFTPELRGVRRPADVGLLYDPARLLEAQFCREWQARLAVQGSGWVVRRNYPYRGTSDGQVVALRRRFASRLYIGLELEISQAILRDKQRRRALLRDLARSLPLAGWRAKVTR